MLIYNNLKNFKYDEKFATWSMFIPSRKHKLLFLITLIIITITGFVFLIYLLFNQQINSKYDPPYLLLYFVITYFVTIILHEIMHLILYPSCLFSDKIVVVVGINKFTTFYNDIISKTRQIIVLLSPLMIYFFLILIVTFCFKTFEFVFFIRLSFVINLIASQQDVSNAILLIISFPKKTLLYADKFYKIQAE
jgi:hypothetical protein